MGILDRFIRQEVQGASPNEVALEEQLMHEKMMRQQLESDPSYTGGKPLAPQPPIAMPPTIEKEVMELYLKVKTPAEPEKLKGLKQFWVFTDDDTATEVPTSNLDAERQKKILAKLQMATDFEGCDNVENLIQTCMLEIHAEILTDKARSDFKDGIRERLVPSIGIGLGGQYSNIGQHGERPRESRAIFGMFGNKGHQG